MPIVGPTSYFVVTQAFINHWSDANTAHGSPISLAKEEVGGAVDVVVANLSTLLIELEGRRDVVEDVAQDVSIKRAIAVGLRTFILTKLVDFNTMMRAEHGSSVYGQSLADAPNIAASRDVFMKPMRDTVRLWEKVNAWRVSMGKLALVAKGGYQLGAFNSAVTGCRYAMDELEELEQQLSLDIKKRDAVQDLIYPILKVYRLKIPAVFAEGHAVIATLPALSPEPGSTPVAPGLTMGWSSANGRAEGTGTPSPSASVVQTQLRGSVGPSFDEHTETVVMTIEAGQPLNFATTWGLVTPGAVASFRAVAMTGDGHERGSAAVVVTRPL